MCICQVTAVMIMLCDWHIFSNASACAPRWRCDTCSLFAVARKIRLKITAEVHSATSYAPSCNFTSSLRGLRVSAFPGRYPCGYLAASVCLCTFSFVTHHLLHFLQLFPGPRPWEKPWEISGVFPPLSPDSGPYCSCGTSQKIAHMCSLSSCGA